VNVILELRQRAGLTQALFARLAGVSPASVSAYENGHTSPTLEMVERLADAVNMELEVTVREPTAIEQWGDR